MYCDFPVLATKTNQFPNGTSKRLRSNDNGLYLFSNYADEPDVFPSNRLSFIGMDLARHSKLDTKSVTKIENGQFLKISKAYRRSIKNGSSRDACIPPSKSNSRTTNKTVDDSTK